MSDSQRILRRLSAEKRWLRQRRVAAGLLAVALAGLLPLLLLGGVDALWTLREGTCLGWAAGVLAAAAALLAGLLVWLWPRLPDERGVALEIEAGAPEFMDSLVCAAELARRPRGDLNVLNLALLEQVAGDLERQDVHAVVRRRGIGTAPLLTMALAALLLTVAVVATPFARKAAWRLRDTLGGAQTGIAVLPGDVEIARGDDLAVQATVRRGPAQPRLEVRHLDGRLARYDLYAAEGGSHAFEFYAVDEAFAYRVVTPTLASRWYRVGVFPRPEFTRIAIHIQPPLYTGEAARTLEEFQDAAAPRHSRITFVLHSNLPCRVALETPDGRRTLSSDDREHRLEFTLDADLEWRPLITDDRGHEHRDEHQYRLECLEDFAPVVEILAPADDAKVEKDAVAAFEARVTDDYGSDRVTLHYSINGRAWQVVEMFAAAADQHAPRELEAETALELAGKVEYGDVVSYHVQARDRAEPEPNHGSSDIRFLEIRPSQPESGDQQEGSGEPSEMARLDVSDLIMQQKQLIRQTWQYLRLAGDSPDEDYLRDLSKAAGDLLVASRQRYNQLQQAAAGMSLGKAGDLFAEAIENMANADLMLREGLAEDSLPFQQTALSRLVALEVELLKNAQRMQQQGGQGQSQEQQQPKDDVREDKERERQRQERLAEMQQRLEQLESLLGQQRALNDRLEQAGDDLQPERREFLAREQEAIERRTQALREALGRIPEAGQSAREVQRAENQMAEAAEGLRADRPANARRHGEQAEQFLDRGRELLQKARDQLAGNRLESAAAKLDQLRQEQQDIRAQAQGKPASAGENRALAKRQGQVREQFEGLLDELAEAARQMNKDNPEAARQLAEQVRKMRDDNVDGKMKRAENALQYRRPERAVPYQQEAEKALEQLAEGVRQANGNRGQVSPEELTEMLRQTLEQLEAGKEPGQDGEQRSPEDRAEWREQSAETMKEIAKRLGDKDLQRLAQEAEGIGAGGGARADQEVSALLNQTARFLERRLFEAAMLQKLELARLSGRLPPDEYRKLVNKYFESLGELRDE